MKTDNILIPSKIKVTNILRESDELTFLIGAGISMEPPSYVASAQEIVKTIIDSCVKKNISDKLLDSFSLRYDLLIQKFRDYFDPNLKILRYFKQDRIPNLIHLYLAEMIKKHNIVMTTNFDELIEKALGYDDNLFRIIITENDFRNYSNPFNNQNKDLNLLYKLHGDLKNPVTGEDTSRTIISTLDTYRVGGMNKILPIESYKIPFFKRACNNRTLIILGYSGSDDFDIVPTLLQMEQIKRIIWVSHEVDKNKEIKKYTIDTNRKLKYSELEDLPNELKILYRLNSGKKIRCDFIKQHTGNLISRVIGKDLELTKTNEKSSFQHWFKENFKKIDEKSRLNFTIDLLMDYGLFDDALYYCNEMYQESLSEQDKFRATKALCRIGNCLYCKGEFKEVIEHYSKNYGYILKHGGLGRASRVFTELSSAHSQIGETQKSLKYAFKALEIYKKINNEKGIASIYSRIGCAYRDTENFKLGLQYHQKSYNYNKKSRNLRTLAFDLANISDIYISSGQLSKALKYLNEAKQIFTKLSGYYGLGLISLSFGMLYYTKGNNRKALEYYEESYKYGSIVSNTDLMAASLGHIGSTCVNLRQFKKAKASLKEAIELDEVNNNLFGVSTDYINMGYLSIQQQKSDDALKCYSKAYKILKNIGDQKELANCIVGLGNAYLQKEETLKAENYYKKAHVIYKNLNYQMGIADTLFNMGLVKIHQMKIIAGKKYLHSAASIFKRLGHSSRVEQIKKIITIVDNYGEIRFS